MLKRSESNLDKTRVDSNLDKTRMDSIMHVDTPALLKTLKELESQLSQYQRQDIVPKWAEAILPRLDLLEKDVRNVIVPPKVDHSSNVSLRDMEHEDIFTDKIRKIVDNRTESLKLTFDSKLSSSSLELDRIHKLLYIRPTTSELQQVVMQVREVDARVIKGQGEVFKSIQTIVQEQLANEMESMVDRLRTAEQHNNKAVELVLSKVNDVESDVRKVRDGAKDEFDQMIKDLRKIHDEESNMGGTIAGLENTLNEVDARCQQALDAISKTVEEVSVTHADSEAALNERIDGLEDSIAAMDEAQKDDAAKNDERYEELQFSISSLQDKLDEFKNFMSDQIEGIKTNQENISSMLEKTIERQQVVMNYVNKLEKFQPMEKINDCLESVVKLHAMSAAADERADLLKQDIKEILTDQLKMQEELEDVPNKINVESLKIDAANKDIRLLKDGQKSAKSELQNHTLQLDELSVLKVDMIMVKGVSEAQDDRIKKMIRQVVEAGENCESQERRLDAIVHQQEIKDERTLGAIESVRTDFEQKLESQTAEMEAKVEVLKDTLVSGGGASSMPGSSKMASSRTMKKNLKGSAGVISDDSSAKRIIEMIEEEDNQRQESAEDLVISETSDKIDYLVQLCLNFEEIASFRNAVPRDVPNAICHDIAACAQAVAHVVAETADLQAIQRLVRGAPQDIVYEDTVAQKRASCLDNIIKDMRAKLKSQYPDAGLLRLEARDVFISRLSHALQVAISKYDQVLTTGHTRLGRVSVPSCIACDRPLLSKAPRQSSLEAAQEGLAGGSSQYTQKNPLAPIGQVHNPNQSFFEPTQSSYGTQISSSELDARSSMLESRNSAQSRSAVRIPGPNQEMSESLDGDRGRGKEYAQYVKRGGFKMPPKLPQLSSSGPPKY